MSYYVELGAHFINVSEYRITRYCYNPVKFLNSAVISLNSAREHAYMCMSMCVCVWMFVYCFVGVFTYFGYSLQKDYITRFVVCLEK